MCVGNMWLVAMSATRSDNGCMRTPEPFFRDMSGIEKTPKRCLQPLFVLVSILTKSRVPPVSFTRGSCLHGCSCAGGHL